MTRQESIEVLVVDDSALVREVLTLVLRASPGITVSTASDPLIAMRKMATRPPDVMILDLRLPHMDGLTFLRKVMSESPLPVVVCSAYTDALGRDGIEALRQGAVAIVEKPTVGVRDFLEESARTIVDAVRAAAEARPRAERRVQGATMLQESRVLVPRSSSPIVAIGASTGGTEALATLFEALPPQTPGLVVVQHIPARFTRALAESLDRVGAIRVREAAPGDAVLPGQALLSPGDRHLRVRRRGAGYFVELDDGPPVHRHRPSVDVLFHSIAEEAGDRAIGVLLTGMGEDGAEGLAAIQSRGGLTLAQDEESCVVFGMPRAAIERGAVKRVLSLRAMTSVIARAGYQELRT